MCRAFEEVREETKHEQSIEIAKSLLEVGKMTYEEIARCQDILKNKQRQFSQSESCRCLCIGAYKFFARFLMSSAIEGLASNLVSAAAASASTALFSGMGCAV